MAISVAGSQAGNAYFVGTGTPQGVVVAGIGTLYVQTDGAAGTSLWVKEAGTGATGWTPVGTRSTERGADTLSAGATYRANMDRMSADGNLAALTTQVMTSVAVPLQEGDVVTNITFLSATTAAGTPTNWWFALYSTAATPALLAQTADQTTTAWAANTTKALALAAPYTVTVSGTYYASIMVKATTVPTLAGVAIHNAAGAGALVSGQSVLARTSGSALTDTAPATIATPTTVNTVPLVIIS